MRAALIAALFLAACGANGPSLTDDVANDGALPAGVIVGDGENWRLVIDQSTQNLTLTIGDDEEAHGATFTSIETTAPGRHEINGEMQVVIEQRTCQHHELTYPMRISVTQQGQPAREGCAAMRWDHQLMALLPQIDACIAQSPQTRVVRYAGSNGEHVLVRLEGENGQVDCNADAGAAPHAAIVVRQDEIFAPTEGDAIFMRGPGENPGGECYTAPEVRGADGALIGWMLDPYGC